MTVVGGGGSLVHSAVIVAQVNVAQTTHCVHATLPWDRREVGKVRDLCGSEVVDTRVPKERWQDCSLP